MKIILILIIIIAVNSVQKSTTPAYTEDITTYKQDRYKQRLQLLVGCWIASRQYHPIKLQQLSYIKLCLKYITRKDSILKITSLVGKNMSATKSYSEIVPAKQINQLEITNNTSQFDIYLLSIIKTYQQDLVKVEGQQGKQLVKKMEQQVEKRSKYFGIFPKTQWTHFIFLTAISLIMVLLCTCFKYFKKNKEQTDRKQPTKKGYKRL